MANLPWLTLLIVIPLLGAALTVAAPRLQVPFSAKQIALGTSLLTLAIGVLATFAFDRSAPGYQFTQTHEWIPGLSVSFALGVDGISWTMILLGLVLTPLCLLAAWHDVPEGGAREGAYFALLLTLLAGIVTVFAARDVFLFYVAFEALLIPIYFLIGMFGGEGRRAAANKFLIFSLGSGLLMLVAVIGLWAQGPGGAQGFLVENLTRLNLAPSTEKLLFLGFFIAFAVKAPMVPVHSWLPDASAASTPAVATLLIGVLDKLGTYGMLRFCLQFFPNASQWAAPVVMTLAVISIVYGALQAIGSTNLMRLISWTSISHFGFMVMGIFAFNQTAGTGAAFYMINHGLSTAALFLVVGMMYHRRRSMEISAYGGWQRVTPVLAGVFLISGLSALSLPGLSTFVSEFLVITGTFVSHKVFACIAVVGIVLAALYVLLMYKKTMTGPAPEGAQVADLDLRERWVIVPLLALLILMGFVPKLGLSYVDPAVGSTFATAQIAPAPGVLGSK